LTTSLSSMELMETLEKIAEARELIKRYEEDPDALSKLALRISTYNAYLGDYSTDAYMSAASKRVKEYSKQREEGAKPSPADNEAKYAVREDEAYADKLNKMHRDSANLVSTIQTRLRVLENQLKNEI